MIVTSDYHLARAKYIFNKIFGPSYELVLESAESSLTQKIRKEQGKVEKKILDHMYAWFGHIKDGNDQELAKVIFTKDPGYTKSIHLSHQNVAWAAASTDLSTAARPVS